MAVSSSDRTAVGRTGPRPGRFDRGLALAWAVPFALIMAVLLIRNAFLFTAPEYENADFGANSILIEQARRLSLLVGNYSREHFNHPGPAFLYVQSWGESVFYDTLHVVPTPWNGQLIAQYGGPAIELTGRRNLESEVRIESTREMNLNEGEKEGLVDGEFHQGLVRNGRAENREGEVKLKGLATLMNYRGGEI